MLGKKEIREILQSRFKDDLHTKISQIPRPEALKDVYKAAQRIKKALQMGEKIVIVGDYDVDGIVSSVILSDFLKKLGANLSVKIPNRFTDGYGLNTQIITDHCTADLIITVDNGISALKAACECKKKHIDLIITDHHMCPDVLPNAYAIVNPKQPDCNFPNVEICGAQVAWYLIGALKDVCDVEYDLANDLDLLILAIIADMMELRDMNRVLVKMGLKRLNNSKRVCFRALKNYFSKEKFEFDDIGFLISPLINSSGRMDDAQMSFNFLSSTDIRDAERYLAQISEFNSRRKEEERKLYEKSLELVDENDDIIVVWGENWHEGVIGIVASRLAKTYNKPSIVFSIEEERVKGSGRSVGRFDLLNAVSKNAQILGGFGGHKGAVGICIERENLEEFKRAINQNISVDEIHKSAYEDEILGEIDFAEFDNEMLEIIEFYEPYGQKNPKPTFLIKDAKVISARAMGRDGNHQKLILEKENIQKETLFFNFTRQLHPGMRISAVVSITKNVFRGVITPEFVIKELIND